MRYRRLDLNLLVALDALLTHQHVTRAAEHLNITQSGMSGSLARLRQHFSDPLIVRVGRRNMLTPLAVDLIDPVRNLLRQADRLLANRPDFEPSQSDRHFSVVCSDYVSDVLMVDVLGKVAASAPGVSVSLEGVRDEFIRRFEAGELEFLIVREEFGSAGHPKAKLFSDNYVCIVWTGNTDVGETLSLKQYLAMTHVRRINEWTVSTRWRDAVDVGLSGSRRIAVNASHFMVPKLVVGTHHCAIIHERTARTAAQTLDIRILPLPTKIPMLTEVLLWQRHQDDDPAVGWLRGQIIETDAQLGPA